MKRNDSSYFREYLSSRELQDVVRTYWGIDQADSGRLLAIVHCEFAGQLDLVIDDASHWYAPTKKSFETLFPLPRPGGLYVIEDWAWGFWPKFRELWPAEIPLEPLVVELVDATGSWWGEDSSQAWINSVTVWHGFVAVERGDPGATAAPFRLDALTRPADWLGGTDRPATVRDILEEHDRLSQSLAGAIARHHRLQVERDSLAAELRALRDSVGWKALSLYRGLIASSSGLARLHRILAAPIRWVAGLGRRTAGTGS